MPIVGYPMAAPRTTMPPPPLYLSLSLSLVKKVAAREDEEGRNSGVGQFRFTRKHNSDSLAIFIVYHCVTFIGCRTVNGTLAEWAALTSAALWPIFPFPVLHSVY